VVSAISQTRDAPLPRTPSVIANLPRWRPLTP
jgi:hypothetical protein